VAKGIAIGLCSALVVLGVASPSRATEPSAEFRASVQELMELSGASQMGLQVANGAFQSVVASLERSGSGLPQRAVAILQEVASELYEEFFGDSERLLDDLTPVYARYFTKSEIDELVAFYRTPIGQKSIRVMPMIVQESMAVGQRWAEELEPVFMEEARRRLTAEGFLR